MPRARVRPAVHPLEAREVPAVAITDTPTTVTFTADDAGNSLRLRVVGDVIEYDANGAGFVPLTNARAGTITQLAVYGGAGPDVLDLGGVELAATVELTGGDGDDTLVGTAGPDRLDGGPGQDAARFASGATAVSCEVWNPFTPAADNQTQRVKVLVLNYDPAIPSQGGRRMWDLFNWGDPRPKAEAYAAEMERASGGYLDYEVVEWRDLDEIPALADGHRYGAEEYYQARQAIADGARWEDTVFGQHPHAQEDYARAAAEQGVPALVDAGLVDEVWFFGDHYYGISESFMFGPGAFYINGPVYPEVPTSRPFAGFGFSHERGVAEMLHNNGHRTEATLNRVYGDWNLPDPRNAWERFSANAFQSNGVAGVGTAHFPTNGTDRYGPLGYDYDNPDPVPSFADDYLDYPALDGVTRPIDRSAWAAADDPDPHRSYFHWYFTRLPRAAGTGPDGMQNNWWKYLYDFDNYTPDGQPLPLRVRAAETAAVAPAGESGHTVRVAYAGAVPIAADSLDADDLRVVGPDGVERPVTAEQVSDPTDGTFRVVTYRVAAPAGVWGPADAGTYTVTVRPGAVRDTSGAALAETAVGSFQVIAAGGPTTLTPSAVAFDLRPGDRRSVTLTAGGPDVPDQNVTADARASSSDEAVVVVEAGQLRAVGVGTATVTYTYAGLSATVSVTVTAPDAPTAALVGTLVDVGQAGGDGFEFAVRYQSGTPVRADSLGDTDVTVTGPFGTAFARFVSWSGTDGSPLTATYRFTPPGGTWDRADNGAYRVELAAGEVLDADGRGVPAGPLGTFAVSIPPDEQPVVRPSVSAVPDQTVQRDGTLGPIRFAVSGGGPLTVTAVSSDPSLLPVAGLVLAGDGSNRTLTVTPAGGRAGTATVTLTVTDAAGGTAVETFAVTVTAPSVSSVSPGLVGYPGGFAVGADRGGFTVRLYRPDGTPTGVTVPAPAAVGGVRVAAADLTGDGVPDVIVGTGPGTASEVRVIDGATGTVRVMLQPFESAFVGGVNVTVGDLTGDGVPDLIVCPDEGGGPRVVVYDGRTFAPLVSFFGIDDPAFRGGARAAAGDLNGDGRADLIVAAGFGGGPRVAGYDGRSVVGGFPARLFADRFVFEPALRNGAYVTAGDLDADGFADLIAGGGPGGGPRVLALGGRPLAQNRTEPLADFFAGDVTNRGGVRVAVKDLDGDAQADLLIGAGTGAGSRVTGYRGASLNAAAFQFDALPGFAGGVFVG